MNTSILLNITLSFSLSDTNELIVIISLCQGRAWREDDILEDNSLNRSRGVKILIKREPD
jgi:hypothetical protein